MVATPYQPRRPEPVAGAGQSPDHTSVVLVPVRNGAVNAIWQPPYGPWLDSTKVARPPTAVLVAVGGDVDVSPWIATGPPGPPAHVVASSVAVTTRVLSPVTRRPLRSNTSTVTTVQLGASLLWADTAAIGPPPLTEAGWVLPPPLETASLVPGPTTRVVSAAVVPAMAMFPVVVIPNKQ